MELQEKMRIYVGGLGESVTEQDIRNTFSKSGTVDAVEFVRTKGRSFAYIDFLPSSDKSVAKLFSTYNGCAWKGGKLRLEKAKLHYLERLKREWAEDADLASKTHDDDDDTKNMVSSVGQEEALDESSQIHMFFPRLRKVKSLPYKGTGKHKYSFQRIEASAHPVHFCDCAEHAGKFNTTQIRHASMKDGGMNEDEINMMNSVLNKFLKREVAPSNHLPDDQNHNGDSTDDDNIIINAVAGPNDVNHLLHSMKKQTGLQTKMARSKKLQSQNNVRIHKGKHKNFRKNGKLVQVKESDKEVEFSQPNRKQTWMNQSEREPESSNTKEKYGRKQSIGNTSLSLSNPGVSNNEAQPESGADDLPNGDSKAASASNVEQLNEAANTGPKNVASDRPTRSMSWMKLVSSANNTPFSLSQTLPETNVSKKSTQISRGQRTGINKSIKPVLKRKRDNMGEGLDFGKGKWMDTTSEVSNLQGHGKKRQKLDIQQSAAPEGNLLAKADNSNESNLASSSGSKFNSQEKKTFSSDHQISDTCLFMRTESSIKDWAKTKKVLSRSLKKKK